MSSYAPPNSASQRPGQAEQHRGANHLGSSEGGISDKISDFFHPEKSALPMYKDKPYGYPASRRASSWYSKRNLVIALGGVSIFCWWFGILSPLSIFASSSGIQTGGQSSGRAESRRGSSSWGRGGAAKIDWTERAEKVKDAFRISFNGYEKYAWGHDEFSPISKKHRQMTESGMGWIIIDAIDTMMIMNMSSELTRARDWIQHSLTYDQDHDVNTFETTIRMLGGLLSAHYLSTNFPGRYAPVDDKLSDDLYIEKATALADRLLGAYDSKSGIPFASVNLHFSKGILSHADAGASSTAEAGTLQLEMKYLSHLTGETSYWKAAERVMQVIDSNHVEDGLVPIFINANTGEFQGNNIRLGSRGDSYYEYLIKQYLQTSQKEPIYEELWDEALGGVKKHLITYSHPSNFTVLAERPNGLTGKISPKMDHLVCFMPGTIALAVTGGSTLEVAKARSDWTAKRAEDMRLAEELMKTCWGMYKTTPSGLAAEITHFQLHDPPLMYTDLAANAQPQSPPKFDDENNEIGVDDFYVKSGDSHNLQRPETVESLFYMWRITRDQKYRDWGWEMFKNFERWTKTEDGEGYSSLSSVLSIPPPMKDNMESFWLAETLKYFYLLFAEDTILPLEEVVFNTEAHPFPRFELGKLFKTGWQREKP